jgi:hypothetical protein
MANAGVSWVVRILEPMVEVFVLRCEQMPTDHILSLLIAERDKLTRAIEVLQGTTRSRTQRTNPEPTIDSVPNAPTPNHTRKRRVWTQAMRLAARRRAKAVWARKRKAEAKR